MEFVKNVHFSKPFLQNSKNPPNLIFKKNLKKKKTFGSADIQEVEVLKLLRKIR